MVRPVVLFTNLFTLEGRDVTKNKYIDMYYIWLNNLVKYGKLNENDYYVTFVDEVTFKFISSNIVLNFLVKKLSNVRFIQYQQPRNIKEGIMKRYDIEEIQELTKDIEHQNPFYIHLDIDVLIVNDIHTLFKEDAYNETTIYLKSELYFDFLSGCHYGELASEEDKEFIKKYFDYIKNLAKTVNKEFYTVEQPFFCAAIFNYFFKEKGVFKFVIFDNEKAVENPYILNGISEKIVLINYCGNPGDESLHWDKMLLLLIYQNLLT